MNKPNDTSSTLFLEGDRDIYDAYLYYDSLNDDEKEIYRKQQMDEIYAIAREERKALIKYAKSHGMTFSKCINGNGGARRTPR